MRCTRGAKQAIKNMVSLLHPGSWASITLRNDDLETAISSVLQNCLDET